MGIQSEKAEKNCRSESEVWAGWRYLADPSSKLSEVAAKEWIEAGNVFEGGEVGLDPIWRMLRKSYRNLVVPEPSQAIRWDRDQTRVLMIEVRAAAPAGRSFAAQWRVSAIIERGNQTGRWKIPIPNLVAPLPAEDPSPFEHARFGRMVGFERFADRFVATLSPSIDDFEESEGWGRLFASAAIFGGLLRPRWLWALTEAAAEGSPDCVALDLYDTAVGETTARHLRWYPDPLTRKLLVDARRANLPAKPAPERRDGTQAYRLIARYARRVGIADALPLNWRELRSLARFRLAVDVPPYLIRHADGSATGTSLPPHVHRRSVTPEPVIRTDVRPGNAAAPGLDGPQAFRAPERARDEDVDSEGSRVPDDLRELAAVIRGRDPVDAMAIKRWVDERQKRDGPRLLPSVVRLAEWASEWLGQSGRGRRKSRMRTVYARYNAVAARLVGQLGERDPVGITDPDDIRELYQNAVEDTVTSASRRRVVSGLQSFHRYLVKKHGLSKEPLEELDIAPGTGRRGVPDANFVDPLSFARTLTWLEHLGGWGAADEPRLVQLMAVLGYYAGLRRSEAAGLQVQDIERGADYDLVIRPNQARALKSASANRVLPLRPLLPRQWLARLLQWQRRRRREVAGSERISRDAPLLAVSGRETLRQRDRQFDSVTLALTQVTGDPGLRYHHLRHSFASRMLVLAWEHENGHSRSTRHVPWISGAETDTISETRRALLGDAPVQRRTLRLVSRLLGHADTQITVEHYVHSLDELLGRAVRRTVDHLSDGLIAGITGRSESQVRATRRATVDGASSSTLELLVERQLPRESRPADTVMTDEADRRALRSPAQIARPEDLYDRWALWADGVNAMGLGSNDARVVYPWKDESLAAAAKSATSMPAGMRRRRSRAPGEGPLIDRPKTRAEQALARRTLAALYGDSGQEQEPVLSDYARGALMQAYRRGWRSGPWVTVRLDTLAAAKHWTRLLQAVGMDEDFAAAHLPGRDSRAGSPRTQRAHWGAAGLEISPGDQDSAHALEEPRGSRGALVVGPRAAPRRGRPMQYYGLAWAMAVACSAENC